MELTKIFQWIVVGVICILIISYTFVGVRLAKPVNIFDDLEQHHKALREILVKVERKEKAFLDAASRIGAHHSGEETVLFSVLKAKDNMRKEALIAEEEHHVIDTMLREIRGISREDERWDAKFAVMKEFLEHHFHEEEAGIFPEARKLFDEKAVNDMGKRFEKERSLYLLRKHMESPA